MSGEIMKSGVSEFMEDERLRRLLNQPTELPLRHISYGGRDRFDLLTIDDTYEPIVGMLFEGCETIEEHLLSKRQRKPDEISLPEVAFDRVRAFVLTRTELKDQSKQFNFHRVGKPKTGFILLRNSEGHILLRQPEQGDTPFTDDKEYGALVVQAIAFLQEYALKSGITKEDLINRQKPEKPPRVKRPISPILKTVGKVAFSAGTLIGIPTYTVYGAVHQGSIWRAAAVRNDIKHISNAEHTLAFDQSQLYNFTASLGAICAKAIAPYSPDASLKSISIADAASQLQREDRCNDPGENTQLEVQQYSDDISAVDNDKTTIANDKGRLKKQLDDRTAEEQYGALVISGLAVGAFGDCMIASVLWSAYHEKALDALDRLFD